MLENPYVLGLLGAIVVIAIGHFAEKYLIHSSRRKPKFHPEDHGLALERVAEFIDLVRRNPDAEEMRLIALLTEEGVPHVDACLLACFVPTAFS